ncbi:hypothetical protein pb186bvf_000601 [Paramecium bursaria]
METFNPSQDEPYSQNDKSLLGNARIGFIRKVYSIISMQLMITTAFTYIILTNDYLTTLVVTNIPLMIFACLFLLVTEIIIICCRSQCLINNFRVSRKVPTNYILLLLFTISMSYLVSISCAAVKLQYSQNGAELILIAAAMTTVATIAVTIYSITTDKDFTTSGAFLFAISVALLIFGISLIFYSNKFLQLIYLSLMIILYIWYLIYDTQLIAGGRTYELDFDDYIIGALLIYVDIMGLFLEILRILVILFVQIFNTHIYNFHVFITQHLLFQQNISINILNLNLNFNHGHSGRSSISKLNPLLIQSTQEWKNINDIIRLTFKAITDVVKNQAESIRELEKQISTRASKNELHTGLSLKSNINDISKTIAELATNLDSKISYEDSKTILNDYVLKNELQYLLSSKLDIDEVRQIMEKQQGGEFKQEFVNLKQRVDDLQQSTSKKFTQLPSMKEFSQLMQVVEQKANLQEINEALETKASKHQVQQAISKKIGKQELEQLLQNYSSLEDIQPIIQALDQKASLDQIDKIASILEMKVDRTDFTILINSLQTKAEMHQFEQIKEQLQDMKISVEQRVQDALVHQNDLKIQLDVIQKMSNKKQGDHQQDKYSNSLNTLQIEIDTLSQKLGKVSQEIYVEQQKLRNEVLESKQFTSEQMQSTIMKSSHLQEKLTEELYNISEQLKQLDYERRSDIEEVQKAMQKLLNQKRELQFKLEAFSEQFEENKSDPQVKQVLRQVQNVTRELNEVKAKQLSYDDEHQLVAQIESQLQRKFNEIKKSTGGGTTELKGIKQEISQLLSKKIGHFEQQLQSVEQQLKSKVLYQDFDELKNIIQKLCIDQDERAYQKDLQKHIQLTKYTLDLIQKDMIMKANIQDMCTLLDNKANILDVNKVLDTIQGDLSNKVSSDELTNYLKNQTQVYESLCQENIVGRFQWRSGELQNHLIQWEFEVINTLPENFVWEKNKTSILIVAPGVYHISYAFFAKDKQTIQVLINGESIHQQEVKKRNTEYLGVAFQEFISKNINKLSRIKGRRFFKLKKTMTLQSIIYWWRFNIQNTFIISPNTKRYSITLFSVRIICTKFIVTQFS